MNQESLDLDPRPAASAAAAAPASTGFALGWDHARHGLAPPPDLLADAGPVAQGWHAGRSLSERRATAARAIRRWLEYRTTAWRQAVPVDLDRLTPYALQRLERSRCPVTRAPLGGRPGTAYAPVFVRLDDGAPAAPGNLVQASGRAAAALAALAAEPRAGTPMPASLAAHALARARRIDAGIDAAWPGLTVAECWRLASLLATVAPIGFADAARTPLRLLPPACVEPACAVWRLQHRVTQAFAEAPWSLRVRVLGESLAAADRRHDFHLFIGAYAPRLLEAGAHPDRATLARVLEDAWADARVQRRWTRFVLALGEPALLAWLGRIEGVSTPRPTPAPRRSAVTPANAATLRAAA